MLRLPVSSLILPTVHGHDGALGLGRNHMPRTHRVMRDKEAAQHNPYNIFLYRCFSVYFCFLSGRIKYFSMSPIDIIVLSQGLQAQHKIECTGASQQQE